MNVMWCGWGTCVALCVVWVCDFFIFILSHELWQIKVTVNVEN